MTDKDDKWNGTDGLRCVADGCDRNARVGMFCSTHCTPSAAQVDGLKGAIMKRERFYVAAIDRIRELAADQAENEIYDITITLREAVELVRCLGRLVPSRTANEIHRAFGAPGDFGYDTPIGDALARLYRGEK